MRAWYIANFAQLKWLNKQNDNYIIIATTLSEPPFYHAGTYDKNRYVVTSSNHVLGITEPAFLLPGDSFEQLEEHCEPNCPWKYKNPNCGFLKAYRAHLDTIDFDWLLSEFNRIAEDVRKITHYEGEPVICLLVWEAVGNPCSEREPIKELFKKHGIELKDLQKDSLIA